MTIQEFLNFKYLDGVKGTTLSPLYRDYLKVENRTAIPMPSTDDREYNLIDAESKLKDGHWELNAIIESEGIFYLLDQKCKAPEGCIIDWTYVHCTDVLPLELT
jgi:hypothetical protein